MLKDDILFTISQIDTLLDQSEPLIKKCSLQEPDFIELAAAGSIMHSFYNGIESALVLIAKSIDDFIFSSGKWHRELLNKMFEENEKRPAVFEKSVYKTLNDYLAFRHFFRHSYGYQLKWQNAANCFWNCPTRGKK